MRTASDTTDETTLLRQFLDAVADLATEPTAPNVARYLRASTELEQWERDAPVQRSFR